MMHLQRLLDHLRWADERILEILRGTDSPPPAALEIYRHILGAEHVWLARLRGEPATHEVWPELSLEECVGLARENVQGLSDFLESSQADLDRSIEYRNSAGHFFATSIEDILLHVAMHGQYHRGQVNLLLRQQRQMTAAVDYVAFVRGGAAATRG